MEFRHRMAGESRSKRAVVLLSGGMDSCVCTALAAKEYEVAALHISYGQRTEAREQEAYLGICERLGISNRLLVRNEALRAIGGSALTDPSLAVPEAREVIGGEVPITYVPFRNAHFLAVAVSWAEVIAADKVFIGAVQQDSSRFKVLSSRLDDNDADALSTLYSVPSTEYQAAADAKPNLHLFHPDDHQPFIPYVDIFPGRSYLLAELFHGPDDAAELDRLINISNETGLPLVAAGDVHYHSPARQPLFEVLTSTRLGTTVAS